MNCAVCLAPEAVAPCVRCGFAGQAQLREPAHALSFKGQAVDFFGIHLKNLLLIPLTLGIYHPWARVSERRFMYGQTELMGERFAFHGTGWERLKGLLKLMIPLILLVVAATALDQATQDASSAWTTLALYLCGAGVAPFAIVASWRYRLSRTAFNGVRFSYRGTVREMYGLCLKGFLLTVVTLGLYGICFQHDVRAAVVRNVRYGTARFGYDGTGQGLIPRTVVAGLLSFLTLGLYSFWFGAYMHRYYWGHTTFQQARFRSTLTGGQLCALSLTNLVIVVGSLGLALPWAQVRAARVMQAAMTLHGAVDLAAIRQDAQGASATGEDLGELVGLELSL